MTAPIATIDPPTDAAVRGPRAMAVIGVDTPDPAACRRRADGVPGGSTSAARVKAEHAATKIARVLTSVMAAGIVCAGHGTREGDGVHRGVRREGEPQAANDVEPLRASWPPS